MAVEHGDVVFPKLFITALEDAFELLSRKGYGIYVNGKHITHLLFADGTPTVRPEVAQDEAAIRHIARSVLNYRDREGALNARRDRVA
ncbi:hypothetical protein EVAR_71023_1 [Eumeta japonica]|uniref:Uncharacterized protein n=1 Tax=Eumeta variegata TaxID=151549 RepID=A0A4C2AC10_EUMVA|nr:hypothetical protein EVAR_71023_1 [Eumeta japonica]